MKHHIWHMLARGLALLALFILPAFGVGSGVGLALFLIGGMHGFDGTYDAASQQLELPEGLVRTS